MISTCLAGWVSNLAHLQQVVGHEKEWSRDYPALSAHISTFHRLLCDRWSLLGDLVIRVSFLVYNQLIICRFLLSEIKNFHN